MCSIDTIQLTKSARGHHFHVMHSDFELTGASQHATTNKLCKWQVLI